jgi:hypothetical protein
MDLQGYTFSVKHRAGKHHLLPDAVSRLLQSDDVAYVNTVDDLRDDFAPLNQAEVRRLMTKYTQDSSYIIETINEFRLNRDQDSKLQNNVRKEKLQSMSVRYIKPQSEPSLKLSREPIIRDVKDNDTRTWKGPRSALEKLLDEVKSEPISSEFMLLDGERTEPLSSELIHFLEPSIREAPDSAHVLLSTMTRYDRQAMHQAFVDLQRNQPVASDSQCIEPDIDVHARCNICTVRPQVRRSMRLHKTRLREATRQAELANQRRMEIRRKQGADRGIAQPARASAKTSKVSKRSKFQPFHEELLEDVVMATLEDYDFVVSNYFVDTPTGQLYEVIGTYWDRQRDQFRARSTPVINSSTQVTDSSDLVDRDDPLERQLGPGGVIEDEGIVEKVRQFTRGTWNESEVEWPVGRKAWMLEQQQDEFCRMLIQKLDRLNTRIYLDNQDDTDYFYREVAKDNSLGVLMRRFEVTETLQQVILRSRVSAYVNRLFCLSIWYADVCTFTTKV